MFHEGTGKVMNTIPPNDFSFYEMLNEVVQQEPAGSLDPELMGPIAAIGIVKGKPFAPDARMKKILTEALALANATSRTLFMAPRDPTLYYYPGSGWQNMLFEVGYEFETPIPLITREGVKPFPPTGYRTLDARTDFFYGVTGITPAMAMRLPGIGSTYLWTMVDANKEPFDGAKTYKVTLPKDIPQANFWSFTLYDNMSRSMLDTPQRYPRAGSQSFPSPAAEADADGTTTVYFGPTQPANVKRGNWIQTMPGKGFIPCLRLYSPLEPFFAKSLAAERGRTGELSLSRSTVFPRSRSTSGASGEVRAERKRRRFGAGIRPRQCNPQRGAGIMLTKRDLLRSAALAAITASTANSVPVQAQTSAERPGFFKAKDIAEEGFIYGLPIVMNYGVMYEFAVDRSSGQFKAPFNQIKNEPSVFTYKDTAIVTPNSDTPYSFVWLDLRAEPIVLSVPAVDPKRYYSVQLCDGNTFNYGYIGSRATGSEAGDYMVVGPDWKGATPAGIKKVFQSSTQFSLAIYPHPAFQPGRHRQRQEGAGRLQGAAAFRLS